ncbi:MAG: hypothetical protein OXH22_08785 [Chloroflexi bacterium]|nr:hypothetical protein [Chloroflexota bacterium]
MRNTPALTLLAPILAMAVLFAALANGNSAAAQTPDTPTPVPTTAPADGSGVQDLPPIEGKLGQESQAHNSSTNISVDAAGNHNVILKTGYNGLTFPLVSLARMPKLQESELLKYYVAKIWEETSSVHFYEFPNDFDKWYGYDIRTYPDGTIGGNRRDDITDEDIIAYREQYLITKYADMPDFGIERSQFLKDAFMDIASQLVARHPESDHHLQFQGHGGPGGRLFEGHLSQSDAYVFLEHWKQLLGRPLGVIDMGGPCNKGSFADMENFCEHARYYIASDLLNGGYGFDDFTWEKYWETWTPYQYHNLFTVDSTLEETLKSGIDLRRKRYEYSRNNMIENQVQQANYLYSCTAFLIFRTDFEVFLQEVNADYYINDDLYQYMIDNEASSNLIQGFHDVFLHKVDNRDFFDWTKVANGMLMLDPLAVDRTATPTPTSTPEPTATPTPEPTATPAPEPTATPTQTPEPTETPSPVPGQPTATPTPVPTATPSPVPTATPVPTVPAEVLNRISALETLAATLQSLISTLESSISTLTDRIAALESDASRPTPTPAPVVPTPTTAPIAPTPTPAPGAPTPTPAPAVPTPTPAPIADDPCIDEFTDSGSKDGSWSAECESVTSSRMIIDAHRGSGPHYALYYTFTLDSPADVTVTLDSDEDTFLYLLAGKRASVSELAELSMQHYNDDHGSPVETDACANGSDLEQYDSCITKSLAAGDYTIEASTYDSDATGAFTVTLTK